MGRGEGRRLPPVVPPAPRLSPRENHGRIPPEIFTVRETVGWSCFERLALALPCDFFMHARVSVSLAETSSSRKVLGGRDVDDTTWCIPGVLLAIRIFTPAWSNSNNRESSRESRFSSAGSGKMAGLGKAVNKEAKSLFSKTLKIHSCCSGSGTIKTMDHLFTLLYTFKGVSV